MSFGPLVIGQAAVDAAKVAEVKKVAVGHFGKLVVDEPPPAPVPVAAVPAPVSAPPVATKAKVVTEAYNFEEAIGVAKKNPYDLPRLLDLELGRPDGPRKTVLKAYRELALRGDLGDEIGLTLAETIDKATAEKK